MSAKVGSKSQLTSAAAKEKIIEVKHKCVELKKSGAFTMTQVEHYAEEVGPIFQDMWVGDLGEDKQLEFAMEELFALFFTIASNMDLCSEDQWPLYEKLTNIYNGLQGLKVAGEYTAADVAKFQDQLNEIDSKRVDGKFLDDKGNIPKGQGMLSTILNKSYKHAHQLLIDLESKGL